MWWRRKRDADLNRELQAHLDLEAEDRNGDRQAARKAFGNPTLVQEDTRAAWGWTALEQLAQDLRYALRALRKKPAFTIVAIASLALGIGASTAIFAVVNGVLLRPLPYAQPDRLVRLWETLPKRSITANVVNGWNFLDWRERTTSFEALAAMQPLSANLIGDGEPISVPALQVSPPFFSILGVQPLIGQGFDAAESGPQVRRVILSHSLWQSRFNGDPAVIGKSIVVNGSPATVTGVMPAGFSFPGVQADVWIPLLIERNRQWETGRSLSTIARLKAGITPQQANEDLALVARQVAQERPDSNLDWSAEVVPLLQDVTKSVRTSLFVLLGAVGFLLLIACANVANLFLIRGAERSREVTLRETLGASQVRIFRQFLTESLLVSLLAASAGVVAAHFGLRGLLAMLPPIAALPRAESVGLDLRVLAVTLAISVATAIAFGIAPLRQTGRLDLQNTLRFRAHQASRLFRRFFVAAQIALALVLLTGAALMARSFSRLISVDPGFTAEHILAMDIFASPARYSDAQRRAEYYENVLAELRALPGVESASSIRFLPLEQQVSRSCFTPPRDPLPLPAAQPAAQFVIIGSGYLKTMGIPLYAGREFTPRDLLGSPSVILVNRAFVQQNFPGEDVIGKHLYVCWNPLPNPAEIVGVVGDARQTELANSPEPAIFIANAQVPNFLATLVIRTRGEPSQISRSAVAAIRRVNPDQAVSLIRTMNEVVNNSVARPRFYSLLFLVFAGVGLLLAAIGVYGVVSYSVAQQTQEIGIRIAIGATRANIARMVGKEGLLLASIGLVVGLAGVFAMTRFLATLLFEITPTDPATLLMVTAALLLVAAIAIAIPLRRATRVDPLVALRYE